MTDRVVYKYNLQWNPGEQQLLIPTDHRVVHTGTQLAFDGTPTLHVWCEVDPDSPTQLEPFRVVATGDPIPTHWYHQATIQTGPEVWHIYRRALPV